ncbi:homoserine kinase [Nesterenkonia sp. LB17]|uniref:homoserine kinase n=1 Tax=unclassified Nesterenkonia TaxID=2629769 RepID=UPI001F4D2B40|nr:MULTISPECIES: homoserine kinase [unclassified Nesterenkonia]MCH8561131.1 homoserine kinase [Nesterenkonia sp. DZ6]MCH8562568.1 homoserine kinase [Nesterenkonia sp. YGD6]MCH8565492.1 homoserine kinase [Nesterenkonia sp. LB17]MCH8571404.1 homoserine kinase [Nesterenkonia sp. AY15]
MHKLGQGLAPEQALAPSAATPPAAQGHDAEGANDLALREPLAAPASFHLKVPATSANLGPGYDTMGLALGLYDEITVHAAPRSGTTAQVEITVEGEGSATLPRDASHLVVTLVEKILNAKGFSLPDLQVRAVNNIPHSRGLGSSAAAVASAVMTAHTLLPDGLSDDEKLQIGSRIEGHPDNYVPALRGGVAISWQAAATALGSAGEPDGSAVHPRDGAFKTAPLIPHPDLRTVVAVPNFEQSTQVARDLLPAQVDHSAAAQNSARAALLVHALTSAPELLLDATEDALHQEQRRPAFPGSMALVDGLRAAGFAAVISGAGPTVLVLADSDAQASAAAQQISALGGPDARGHVFTPSILPIAGAGATVEAHQR